MSIMLSTHESKASKLADSPWPCFRGNDKNTGRSQYNTSKVDGTVRWKYDIELPQHSSPAIGPNGTIYVASCYPRYIRMERQNGHIL